MPVLKENPLTFLNAFLFDVIAALMWFEYVSTGDLSLRYFGIEFGRPVAYGPLICFTVVGLLFTGYCSWLVLGYLRGRGT